MHKRYVSFSRNAARHFSYVPFLAVAAGISFLKLLLYARWMDIAEFGLLAKLFVLSNAIGVVGSLGFHLLAHRRVPGMFFNNDEEAAVVEILRSGIAALLVGAVVAVLLVTAVLVKQLSGWVWIFALLHGLLNHVFMIFTVESKSRLDMFRYASSVLGRAVISVGLGVVAALGWKTANAVLLAETIGSLALLLIVLYSVLTKLGVDARASLARRIDVSPGMLLPRLSDWREALVVLLASTATLVSMNADRWLAVGVMTTREFGIYAFAWITMTAAQSAQQIINAGFFPVVARSVAAGGRRRGLLITGIGSLGVVVLGVAFGTAFHMVAPTVIQKYYPEYLAALHALPMFVAAAVLRVSDFWTSYLIIIEHEAQLLKFEVVTGAVAVLGWWIWAINASVFDWFFKFALLALLLGIVSYCKSFWLSIHARPETA